MDNRSVRNSLIYAILASAVGTLCVTLNCARPSTECTAFYSMPRERQLVQFGAFPVEKQLDLYLCGTLRRHPPDIELADHIAEGGEEVIPVVLERTKTEKDEAAREMLLYVFTVMSGEGYLTRRPDVTEELDSIVDSMKLTDFRERARSSVQQIRVAQRSHSDFLRFPVEKQLDLYISGQPILGLPATGLAYDIAQGGKEVIPLLLNRAKLEADDTVKEKLIDVFTVLSDMGNLKGQARTVDEINSIVASIASSDLRERIDAKVEKIRQGI